MIRRRQKRGGTDDTGTRAARMRNVHEWVLSLPWVVEQPSWRGSGGVRTFAVDCAPLGRRRVWLLTGLPLDRPTDGSGIAVILPDDAARAVEVAGLGHTVAPMPADHWVVTLCVDLGAEAREVEALMLDAHDHALS